MDALHELCGLGLMAFTTGTRNIDLGNRRLRIGGRKDVVTLMTISTNSGRDVALRESFRVHTLAVRKKRAIADAAALHD